MTQTAIKNSDPGVGDVHVDVLMGKAKRKKRTAYVNHLFTQMRGKFSDEELKEMVKKARAHAGGIGKAAKSKKAAEGDLLGLDLLDDPEDAPTGLMVGAFLSLDTAAKIAIPGGEAPEDLHVTLCFLGDASIFPSLTLAKIMVAIEDVARWTPALVGKISGVGRFDGPSDDTEDVIYASVDMPGLSALREQIANRLSSLGVEPDKTHGFDPHITLAYVSESEPTPDLELGGTPVRIAALTVCIGESQTTVSMGANMYSESPRNLADFFADGRGAQLFNEFHFADPPEWFNYLPKPGAYTSPRYGEIVITKERNKNFVSNFESKVYQEKLPIDCEHDVDASGAVGWIVGMRLNEDGSVDAKSDWNDRGKALILGDRFKYFSPSWFNTWKDPVEADTVYSDVAIGGALTTRPFFKEKALRPFVANEKGLFVLDTPDLENVKTESVVILNFTAMTPITEGATMATKEQIEAARALVLAADAKTASEALKGATEDQIKAARALVATEDARRAAEATAKDPDGDGDDDTTAKGDTDNSHFDKDGNKKDGMFDAKGKPLAKKASEIDAQTFAEVTGQLRQMSERATQAEAQATKANERVAVLEQGARASRFNELSKEWVGDKAKHVDMLEFLATSNEAGEESQRFKDYVTQQDAAAEQVSKAKLFSEIGSSAPVEGSAAATIDAKAKKMAEDSKGELTYEQAYEKVLQAEPSLRQQYREEERKSVN